MKKYSEIISSEAMRGMNLKLCRNVHNISLYKSYVFYCRCSCAFVAMEFKVSMDLYGKNKIRSIFVSNYRYFDKRFTEFFLELSSTKHIIFVQSSEFYWLPWQPKGKMCTKNIISPEVILGGKLSLCKIVHNISLYKRYVSYCRFQSTFVAMAS